MKFVCDHCQTRYRISDEKVRGKVLKIRCKTCSNIVVVREETAVAEQAKAVVGARGPVPRTEVNFPAAAGGAKTPSKAPDTTEWFVAIKGTQHGPMSKQEVENLFAESKISARSYSWHENLPEWTRIRDLEDFAHLSVDIPKMPPPPPPDDQGADVVDLQAARAKRAEKKGDDPFRAVADAPTGRTVPGQTTGSLRESTRVFIMKAGLHNRKTKHRAYAGAAAIAIFLVAGLGVLDWKGIIKIPGLHSAITFAATTAGVAEPEIRKQVRIKDEISDLETQLIRCELNKVDCPEIKSSIAKAKKKSRRYTKVAAADPKPLDPIGADAFQTGGGKLDDPNNLRASAPTGELASLGGGTGPKDLFKDDMKKKFKPQVKLEVPQVSGGVALTGEQINSVIKANKSAIASCVATNGKDSAVPRGKQYLVLSIEPTGKVSNARFQNGSVSLSPVGRCIASRGKRWRFPAFDGAAFDVDVPLVLSLN